MWAMSKDLMNGVCERTAAAAAPGGGDVEVVAGKETGSVHNDEHGEPRAAVDTGI